VSDVLDVDRVRMVEPPLLLLLLLLSFVRVDVSKRCAVQDIVVRQSDLFRTDDISEFRLDMQLNRLAFFFGELLGYTHSPLI